MLGVQTFILKMLTNRETPGAVIGNLQTIPERELYPFHDPAELIALLEELTRQSQDGALLLAEGTGPPGQGVPSKPGKV